VLPVTLVAFGGVDVGSYTWTVPLCFAGSTGPTPNPTITFTEIHAAGGGPRTFLMIDNELLLIETAMDNSCGTVAGPVFEYRLKNGAMVPVELQ
jgi:hypothetical protein